MELQPADILLWRIVKDSLWFERFIGWGEYHVLKEGKADYQYYHIAFVAANPKYYYSSQPPSIQKFLAPDQWPDNVEVFRRKEPFDPESLSNVFQYAESRRGRIYPFLGVFTAGWLQGNLEFCSQLTEDAFAHYPLLLCPDIRFSTPDDIASSILALGFSRVFVPNAGSSL